MALKEGIAQYVRRFGLADMLDETALAALRLMRYGKGDLIIRSGDDVDAVLFVVEGEAKAYNSLDNGQRVLAAFYQPLDIIGEAELFSSQRYALSVEAMTSAVCLRLGVDTILAGAKPDCRLLSYICGRLGSKLTDRFKADSINLRYTVETRLAMYLLASAGDKGFCHAGLGDIADFIGCSYRQLSRVVRAFRGKGILDNIRGTLVVRDGGALELLADDLYTHTKQ
ncbi:MAG: cyclic nucleotide-binding domain-containing protein [Spirochaetales bacterium]|nr:cyclic nucleotide-binding domain-containing protein [Spirochaetales bacterium]